MKVSGDHLVPVGRQELWDALHDPELLHNGLPGCSQLDRAEPGRYTVTIRVGIPCVEGAYHGDLRVLEHTAPSSLTLAASAEGEQGNGRGQVQIDLDETDGGTRVRYDIDVEVAGAISRVGQRLLASAVDRTVADHLDTVAQACGGEPAPATPPASDAPSQASADRARTDRAEAEVAGSGQDAQQDRRFAPLALNQKQAAATAVIGSAVLGFLIGRRSRR